jgi:thiol-disulfide isomerase/thioredoxin
MSALPQSSRGQRRAAALAGLLLAASACSTAAPSVGAPDGAKLAPLRAAAGLPACPSGVSRALPDLTLPCLSGGPAVPLTQAGTGRPMLVNVWATWCSPCVREVPELIALARAGTGQLDVLGVLTQDEETNGLEFARQFTMNYTSVVDDDGTVMRKFSPGPPVTLFLDAGGTLRHIQRGEIKDSATLRALVRKHLGLAVPPDPGPVDAATGQRAS